MYSHTGTSNSTYSERQRPDWCAQTGTGKTAAFLVPLLQEIIGTEHNSIKTLVVVPTRELARQIDGLIDGLAYHSPVRSIAVYGGGKGEDFSQQQRAFEKGQT
jgi:superfamily II DNA/RNA helicase